MFVKTVLAIPVRQFYTYSVPEELRAHIRTGQRVKVNFNNRACLAYVVDVTDQAGAADGRTIKPVLEIVDRIPLFDRGLLDLAAWIGDYYYASLGEVLKLILPSGLKEKEYAFPQGEVPEEPVRLNPGQEDIRNRLLRLKGPDYALLYGVTGSGKTEIFLSLAEHFIKKKSRCCTLFPRSPLPRSFSPRS